MPNNIEKEINTLDNIFRTLEQDIQDIKTGKLPLDAARRNFRLKEAELKRIEAELDDDKEE